MQLSATDWVTLAAALIGAAAGLYAALTKHSLDRSVAIVNGYSQMTEAMQGRITGLTTEIGRLREQMQEMQRERDALAARVRELECERAELKLQLAELKAQRE